MKQTRTALSLFLLLTLLHWQCKKEEEIDKLPPATCIGAQTFGCLINGKAWPEKGEAYYMIGSGYANGHFYLNCKTFHSPPSSKEKDDLFFEIKQEIYKQGYYIIPFKRGAKLNSFGALYKGDVYQSYYSPDGFAILNICRLDTINFYVSGTFEFTIYSPDYTKSIKVTDGRFDYKYN